MTGDLQTTDWRQLAKAQFEAPGTREQVADIVAALSNSELSVFGPSILKRLEASAYLSVGCFLPALRSRFALHHTYLQLWVFALDEILDTCSQLSVAFDLEKLLRQSLTLSPGTELRWANLPLLTNPCEALPDLGYSLLMLVDAIQPLRKLISTQAITPDGPIIFEHNLIDMVVPAMLMETRWRLAAKVKPDFSTYMTTAHVSICTGLTTSIVNAVLLQPNQNWAIVKNIAQILGYAVRLINDVQTRGKDEREGKPNAAALLAEEMGSITKAEQHIYVLIEDYVTQLEQQCYPFLNHANIDDPLYILSYYMYNCLTISRQMYASADFVLPAAAAY